MVGIPGRYKRSLAGYRTFLPDPLPPVLSLTPAIERAVEEATHLVGQVEMCRTLLPNVDLLIYSSLRREALASSTIEGTIASPDDLIRFQASLRSENDNVREVSNYSSALEWGCGELQTRPIAYNFILGLHERLLQGVRGANTAGRLKDRQNRIGTDPNEPIENAIFIPAAPEDTRDLLYDLECYINNPANRAPRLVQCAVAHYQFETIHPFVDGNGRVGRLLVILQMIQLKLLSAPLIHPSVYFEHRRDDYYQGLQNVRDRGAWNPWIEFFIDGVITQCRETIAFTRTILDLRKQLHVDVANVRRRASVNAVLDAFFHHPVLSITDIAAHAHMSYHAAQSALNELEDLGIVYEITGRQKGRVYGCRPVLHAIFGQAGRTPATDTDERDAAP